MQLIGMLDSPYVRRVAISMQLLGLSYAHQSISVFSTYDQFKRINPVVKAPTLVCDDGELLMDSTLIIDYLETLAGQSLMPTRAAQRRHALKLIGLALAACEKTVQTVYERRMRPAEKQYEPWVSSIHEQLIAALSALEGEVERHPLACESASINQAGITTAAAWRFTQLMLPDAILAPAFPALAAHSARAEQLPAFIAAPPV